MNILLVKIQDDNFWLEDDYESVCVASSLVIFDNIIIRPQQRTNADPISTLRIYIFASIDNAWKITRVFGRIKKKKHRIQYRVEITRLILYTNKGFEGDVKECSIFEQLIWIVTL